MNDIEQLRLLRLERDVSYKDLADQVGVPEATLYRALQHQPVNERTQYKIRRFLEAEGLQQAAS
jgi:transcriptional regulator with XRE-family HTH domain